MSSVRARLNFTDTKAFKVSSYIRICHALKRDTIYESIMETTEYAMYINKEKNFDEALDFATEKRNF